MTQSIPLDRANVSGEYSALRIVTTQSHLLKLGNKLLQVQAQRLFAMLNMYQMCLYSNCAIHGHELCESQSNSHSKQESYEMPYSQQHATRIKQQP